MRSFCERQQTNEQKITRRQKLNNKKETVATSFNTFVLSVLSHATEQRRAAGQEKQNKTKNEGDTLSATKYRNEIWHTHTHRQTKNDKPQCLKKEKKKTTDANAGTGATRLIESNSQAHTKTDTTGCVPRGSGLR